MNINEVELDLTHFSKPKELLGIGGFGLVRRITKLTGYDAGQHYAIKSINKSMVLARHSGTIAVMTELRTLIILEDCDYICRLNYAFQDKNQLYMVLDYASGGDMRFNLRRASMFRFSERLSKIFIMQALIALDHCHRRSILHRGNQNHFIA